MARVRFAVAMTAIATALLAVPASAANLVTNGSFEDALSGWALSGSWEAPFAPAAIFYNSIDGYPTGAFNEPVPENNAPTNSPDLVGKRAAYFVADNAVNQTLSQVFVAAVSGVHQIGFSAYAPANGFGNANDATFSGSIAGVKLADYAVSTRAATTWFTFAGAADLTAGTSYTVEFIFNSFGFPAKDVVIDQVYVIAGNPPPPVPLPAAAWLLGSGLLALFGMARRRRA